MKLSDGERARIAELAKARRETVFNTKIAAYTAAGLNAGTWDSLEAGKPMRDDRLRDAVRTLWPESGGRFELLLSGEIPSDPPRGAALADVSDDALLAEVRRRMVVASNTTPLRSVRKKAHAVTGGALGKRGRAIEGKRSSRGGPRQAKAAKTSQSGSSSELEGVRDVGGQH